MEPLGDSGAPPPPRWSSLDASVLLLGDDDEVTLLPLSSSAAYFTAFGVGIREVAGRVSSAEAENCMREPAGYHLRAEDEEEEEEEDALELMIRALA